MQETFALLSITLGFIGYIPYFRDILSRTTRPHIFSWFIWGLLNATAFGVQFSSGAGIGSAITFLTAVVCLIIVLLSFRNAEKTIVTADWFFLLGSIIAIILWLVVQQPLLSIILLALIDALGFGPSIRKAYNHPHEETASTFFLQSMAFLLGVFALQEFNAVTMIYPIVLAVVNGSFSFYILVRRRALRDS